MLQSTKLCAQTFKVECPVLCLQAKKLLLFWFCTQIPSRCASHGSSQKNDCEERGHLRSENSYFSASLILKGENGQKERSVIQ